MRQDHVVGAGTSSVADAELVPLDRKKRAFGQAAEGAANGVSAVVVDDEKVVVVGWSITEGNGQQAIGEADAAANIELVVAAACGRPVELDVESRGRCEANIAASQNARA